MIDFLSLYRMVYHPVTLSSFSIFYYVFEVLFLYISPWYNILINLIIHDSVCSTSVQFLCCVRWLDVILVCNFIRSVSSQNGLSDIPENFKFIIRVPLYNYDVMIKSIARFLILFYIFQQLQSEISQTGGNPTHFFRLQYFFFIIFNIRVGVSSSWTWLTVELARKNKI